MKKAITWLLTLTLAVGGLGIFAGCNDNREAATIDILLYDFEDYDRNFALMHALAFFGRVDVAEDATYAKSGTGSALLRPIGHKSTQQISSSQTSCSDDCLFIPFYSVKYDFDYTDLTKTESVRFSMYNAEDKVLNVYVVFAFSRLGEVTSQPVRYTLKPGWNEVICTVDHAYLACLYDIKHCYGFAVEFDPTDSRYVADAPKIYLDDVYVRRTASEIPYEKFTREGDVLLDFEESWQRTFIAVETEDPRGEESAADIVLASEYGLAAAQGKMILRWAQPADYYDEGTLRDRCIIVESLLRAMNLMQYDADDALCFEMYNNTDEFISMAVGFRSQTTKPGSMYVPFSLPPKQWATFRMTLGGIDYLFGKEKGFRSEPCAVVLDTSQYLGEPGSVREYFLDNFRIERKK